MKRDKFKNKINFLLILNNIIPHNTLCIFKLVKYEKEDFCFNIFTGKKFAFADCHKLSKVTEKIVLSNQRSVSPIDL